MTSQHNLGVRFGKGAESGQASNVEIRGDELVGYGWAVYFERTEEGDVRYYDGWYGYSQSTSCQLSKLKAGIRQGLPEGNEIIECDDAPQAGARRNARRGRV